MPTPMPDPDLKSVLRRLDAIQKELREGLRIMELREQREASYQTPIQILTGQMVSVATAVEGRLNATAGRLARIEAMLADIARKLDA